MGYWIFQANPAEFHFLDALAAGAIHGWHVKQHALLDDIVRARCAANAPTEGIPQEQRG